MQTLPTDYSHQQLVDALQAEYIQLMHDVEPTDDDFTLDEHLDYLNAMTHAELIVETGTDDENPLSEFMYAYSESSDNAMHHDFDSDSILSEIARY
jgi:hypothetical protein